MNEFPPFCKTTDTVHLNKKHTATTVPNVANNKVHTKLGDLGKPSYPRSRTNKVTL